MGSKWSQGRLPQVFFYKGEDESRVLDKEEQKEKKRYVRYFIKYVFLLNTLLGILFWVENCHSESGIYHSAPLWF